MIVNLVTADSSRSSWPTYVASNAAGTTGATVEAPFLGDRNEADRMGTVQFKLVSGSGNVQVQGSLLPAGAIGQVWTDLLSAALTADGAANITIFPYMRATLSSTILGELNLMVNARE